MLLLATPACAVMAEDISVPTIQELRFSRESIALVFPHGSFKIDRRLGLGGPINPLTLSAEFSVSNLIRAGNTQALTGDAKGVRWALPDGSVLDARPGYCYEGEDQSLQVSRSGKPLETYLSTCDAVSAVALVKHHLWLGSVSPGYYDGPGSGVRVVSLRNGDLLAQFWPKKDLADGLVRTIQADPFGNDIWIASETALHRVHQFKVVERWYWSEQFSPVGKLSYELDSKRKKSATWAVWARATGLADEHLVWNQLQRQPKMHQRLRYAYDEDGYFFSVDGVHLTVDSIKPRSWPRGFDWLEKELMATLQQPRSSDSAVAEAATRMALQQLCFFNDRRVVPFVLDWQRTHSADGKFDWTVEECLKAQRLLGN